MNDYYVYYQVEQANAPALRVQVRAMQARLTASYGVRAQLKLRAADTVVDTSVDATTNARPLQTWMEVYCALPQGFEVTLDFAAREAGLQALCASTRHMEIFMDLTPCA